MKNLPDARNTPSDPRTVKCPICGSGLKQACIDLETGRIRHTPHFKRLDAAEDAKNNE
jgi:hypothetical protein